MRLKSKIDRNQKEIVSIFRSLGCTVQHLHTIGKGCPDIVVGCRGVNLLVEIKDGLLVPSARKLTRDELDWHDRWRGQVCVVEDDSDAIGLIEKTITSVQSA